MKRLVIALCALSLPVMASVKPAEATELPCAKYHSLMREYGLPVRQFAWIMHRESRCIREAVGWNYHKGKGPSDCTDGAYHRHRRCRAVKSWDVGLFQINSSWNTVTKQACGASTRSRILMNVECQFRVARVLYNHGGLAHWRGSSH